MSDILKSLIKNKVHIGNIQRWWNPDFTTYIYTKLKGRYVINLNKTIKNIRKSNVFITNFRKEDKKVLFISSNPDNKLPIYIAASIKKDFYYNEKWMPGILSGKLDPYMDLKLTYEYLFELSQYTTPLVVDKSEYRIVNKLVCGLDGYTPDSVGAVIIVGSIVNKRAVIECKKLGFTIIGLLNTQDTINDIDIVIPCNTYSDKSISTVLNYIIKGE